MKIKKAPAKTPRKRTPKADPVSTTGEPKKELPFEERLLSILTDTAIILDHIKYNLHMLSKSVMFHSAFQLHDLDESVQITEEAMLKLNTAVRQSAKDENQ